ncbi:hypothetical protein [Hymenobacter chitinivorans]|uniref:Uncharacterized protein n=1 Tax=Hymenobacter chitinivorans DSM 11115 TaxID=1121954 RepID=A0A2M9B565_9BACT|nr:hypothetical protein [Hymenobacter chitinivorans]PJJ53091.1 hypothetical protein CLV45_3749 [Hymenobacter chitinivorans DSM 11115]
MGFRQFFNKLKGPAPAPASVPPPTSIRELLFGDLPSAQWPAADSEVRGQEPWKWFAAAQQARAQGDTAAAEQALRQVLTTPKLESRQYLQAWQALRELGVAPPSETAKQVLGVVVEVGLEQGLDLLAAYADGSARYYNYSGAGVVWENPDDSLAPHIGALRAAGQRVADRIGPWEEARPAAPGPGQVRLNLLTPSGLHFGQAPFNTLWEDEMGGPVLVAAQQLMQALIAKHEQVTENRG